MTESTKQSQSKLIKLTYTKDSNDPALSKLIPIVPNTELKAALKLCRKEPQSSTSFENNFRCEPVFCNKAYSEEELKDQLLALAKKWLHQDLYTEFMVAITDKRDLYDFTKIPAVKVIVDEESAQLYQLWQQLRTKLDPTTAAAYKDKDLAAYVDKQFGYWRLKAMLQDGATFIYNDVYRLMLAQSEKMGVNLSNIVNHMTLVIPTQVIPYFTAKSGGLSSAYDMLKVAFPELKIITLPDLIKDKEQFALLLCDDPAYGKPGYLVLHDGQSIKAFKPEDCITTIKYNLAIPQHKLVITNPEQIAVLEGI